MSTWNTRQIIEALALLDEAAVSDGILEITTSNFRLLRFPERFLSPTMPAAQVIWSITSKSLDIVFDVVSSIVREWDLDAVHWWVTSTTRPLDTEDYLLQIKSPRVV